MNRQDEKRNHLGTATTKCSIKIRLRRETASGVVVLSTAPVDVVPASVFVACVMQIVYVFPRTPVRKWSSLPVKHPLRGGDSMASIGHT